MKDRAGPSWGHGGSVGTVDTHSPRSWVQRIPALNMRKTWKWSGPRGKSRRQEFEHRPLGRQKKMEVLTKQGVETVQLVLGFFTRGEKTIV